MEDLPSETEPDDRFPARVGRSRGCDHVMPVIEAT